jgi:ribonuclease D
MQLNLELIDNPNDLKTLSNTLSREEIIAFDTEFVREKTYIPKLALIQVATQTEGWLIDVLAFSADEIKPLLEILTNSKILKVLHSALGDQEALYHTYGVTASPTLDTLEAAGLLGFGESISLRDLIQRLLGVAIGKSHSRTDWLKRPINEDMKNYAIADVQYLVDVGRRMLKGLEELGRKEWALELSAYYQNPRLYEDPSEEIAQKMASNGRLSPRSYAILKSLISWREKRARNLDIPRRRVIDDDTLLDISNARPKTLEQLAKFRGIHANEVQRQGNHILEIIRSFQDKPNEELPPTPSILKPTMGQARIIDLLGTYLRVLCEDLQIASRQLLTAKELRKIVVENLIDPQQWVEAGLCTHQVCELIGKDLVAMMQGKRALKVEGGKLKIIKLS